MKCLMSLIRSITLLVNANNHFQLSCFCNIDELILLIRVLMIILDFSHNKKFMHQIIVLINLLFLKNKLASKILILNQLCSNASFCKTRLLFYLMMSFIHLHFLWFILIISLIYIYDLVILYLFIYFYI